jgi:uncharacterized protein YjbI with pentapeptide repeats
VFRGASFVEANLEDADFEEEAEGDDSIFIRARMQGANLSQCDFKRSDFREADLDDTDMSLSDFTYCDFRGASMWGAYTAWSDFYGALFFGDP